MGRTIAGGVTGQEKSRNYQNSQEIISELREKVLNTRSTKEVQLRFILYLGGMEIRN